MARTVKVRSALKAQKNKAGIYTALAVFFALLFAAAGVGIFVAIYFKKLSLHIAVPSVLIAVSAVCLILYIINRKKFSVLRSGVQGEKNTLNILKKLPNDYTVITNPVLYNRGKVNELDFVVVGKNGVFIVEAKNHRGIISGKTSSQSWRQVKHGKNNRVYEKDISNPVKQAHRQSRRMSELFSDLDIKAEVYPIVYFVDSKSVLKITDNAETGVMVFNREKNLLDYIMNTESKRSLSSSAQSKIIRFFKK